MSTNQKHSTSTFLYTYCYILLCSLSSSVDCIIETENHNVIETEMSYLCCTLVLKSGVKSMKNNRYYVATLCFLFAHLALNSSVVNELKTIL